MAEHQKAGGREKKKGGDLLVVYNKAVAVMTGNQDTEGRGTGARSGSETPDDDASRGQRQEGGVHYNPSRSGNGQSIVNRNIRGKYENRSGTGQSIVNTGGGFRAIFEEEQEETTDPLNTAFDDSNDSEAGGKGTRERRNRGPGGT